MESLLIRRIDKLLCIALLCPHQINAFSSDSDRLGRIYGLEPVHGIVHKITNRNITTQIIHALDVICPLLIL